LRLLFDAADNGAAPDADTLIALDCPPGDYDVRVAEVCEGRSAARLVRLVAR
jgi:hypothetical protein